MYKSFQSVLVSIDMPDLIFLIKSALKHEEITVSRAAELLGMSLNEVRALINEWYSKDPDSFEKDIDDFYPDYPEYPMAKVVDDCGWVDIYDGFKEGDYNWDLSNSEFDEFTDELDYDLTDPFGDFDVHETSHHPYNEAKGDKLGNEYYEAPSGTNFKHDPDCKPDQLGTCTCGGTYNKKCHGVTTKENIETNGSILHAENDNYPAEGGGFYEGPQEDNKKFDCCSDCEDCEWFFEHFNQNNKKYGGC